MTFCHKFGLRLREIRTSRGLTQEELAYRANMSVPYLSDIERGKSSPSLAMLVDLAEALEMHPSDLLKDIEVQPSQGGVRRKRPKGL